MAAMTLERLDDVTTLLRAYLATEAGAGFPRLNRVPSSSVVRFLDYWAGLPGGEREALLDARARLGALGSRSPAEVREDLLALMASEPALLRYHAATRSGPLAMGLRYQSLRMVKSTLGDPESVTMMARTRATLDYTPRDDMPVALVPDPDRSHVKPARAPQLRALISRAFGALFAVEKRTLAGGETGYSGVLDGTPITVWIDFAARDLQLRYGVTIPDESRRVFVLRRTYEELWAPGPGWNYLTEENAEASIWLLFELVSEIVRLRNAVAALM
jgi:hypothetical protein